MTNILLPCLEPLLLIIAPYLKCNLVDGMERPIDAESLRGKIKYAINQFERAAQEQSVDMETIARSKYALIAFIDELVIQGGGEVSHRWAMYPLQLEFFGQNTAGQRFFLQLDELRLQGETFIDALEIYYLCLTLGFEGQFRAYERSDLLKLTQELMNQIQKIRRRDDLCLFMPATNTLPLSHDTTIISFKRMMSAGFVLLTLVALGFTGVIHYQAYQTNKIIISYQDALSGLRNKG